MRFLIILLLCCLCSGCIYLDNAMLDTAEPLSYGKPRFQFSWGGGLDFDSVVAEDSTEAEEETQADGGSVTGFGIGIGLGNDYELDYKTWTGEGRGNRVSLKKRIYHNGPFSFVVKPSVYYLNHNAQDSRQAYGWQTPLLISAKAAPFLTYTVQGSYSRDYYYKEKDDHQTGIISDAGPYIINHGGVAFGTRFMVKNICIYGELGWETVKGYHTPASSFWTKNFGIGMEF